MSVLAKLKLTDATRSTTLVSPTERKREKLLTNIEHQIKAAEAEHKGELYSYPAMRWVTNSETQERTRKNIQVTVRPWWWKDMQGTCFTSIKYGNKKLELSKGKYAIEVGEHEKLVPTLRQIANAVKAGELDDIISGAAKFGKAGK